jgi:hypothetical protein
VTIYNFFGGGGNVAVQKATLVSYIRQVTASNLGVETGHPAWWFREFPQFHQANARCLFNLGRNHLFSAGVSMYYLLII